MTLLCDAQCFRYMMIERNLEGRDVGTFAAEACVLSEDAIEAVNLVNMLRSPNVNMRR